MKPTHVIFRIPSEFFSAEKISTGKKLAMDGEKVASAIIQKLKK